MYHRTISYFPFDVKVKKVIFTESWPYYLKDPDSVLVRFEDQKKLSICNVPRTLFLLFISHLGPDFISLSRYIL